MHDTQKRRVQTEHTLLANGTCLMTTKPIRNTNTTDDSPPPHIISCTITASTHVRTLKYARKYSSTQLPKYAVERRACKMNRAET